MSDHSDDTVTQQPQGDETPPAPTTAPRAKRATKKATGKTGAAKAQTTPRRSRARAAAGTDADPLFTPDVPQGEGIEIAAEVGVDDRASADEEPSSVSDASTSPEAADSAVDVESADETHAAAPEQSAGEMPAAAPEERADETPATAPETSADLSPDRTDDAAGTGEASSEPGLLAEEADADADDDAAEGAAPPASGPAAPAAFGLIFQPPAPRRATRPAGSVRPAPAPLADQQSSDVVEAEEIAPAAGPEEGRAGQRPARRRARGSTATADAGPDEADGLQAGGQEMEAVPQSSEVEDDGDVDDESGDARGRRRRRGGRGRRPRTSGDSGLQQDGGDVGEDEADVPASDSAPADDEESTTATRRRRRRRTGAGSDGDDPPGTVTRVREPRRSSDEPVAVRGSTRLEAKKLRRREGREAGRRRTIITEKEFLARRESVERVMVVRRRDGRTQIGVLEDGVLVEHYVSRTTNASMAGNVYLGRIQNVLPSMEAAFVDIGRGRNAVLYAGEVNWDTAGLEVGEAKRIENVLTSGESVLAQVTKDPIGHKGARLTSQISLPGRYLVYVPLGNMTGISRKLPDTERSRLKSILKEIVPADAGVIVRTAAEGASEEELRRDVDRLAKTWAKIAAAAADKAGKKATAGGAPTLLYGEPDLTVRVIRDVFNEDFTSLIISGDDVWDEIDEYVGDVAPDLAPRMSRWTSEKDVFAAYRIDEQLAKAMDRKVWLPSGGSLVIDRTEAMTVVDVNTGKFVGSGGNLEETVTKNNIEAAEEIVRQLRLRDIGGIIVIDFIDMVLESNRDLVVRRLLECLGRDRTKHQVAEVTSLGLVQMTRKRVGSGLLEVFSEPCPHCDGRGLIIHTTPVERGGDSPAADPHARTQRRGRGSDQPPARAAEPVHRNNGPTAAQIAAAAHAAALKSQDAGSSEAQALAETGSVRDGGMPQPAGAVDDLGGAGDLGPEQAAGATAPAESPAPGSLDGSAEFSEEDGTPSASPEQAAPGASTANGSTGGSRSRGRRRRGRATAPAGPPRSAVGEVSSSDG